MAMKMEAQRSSVGPSSTRVSSEGGAESGLMAVQLVLGTLLLGHCPPLELGGASILSKLV